MRDLIYEKIIRKVEDLSILDKFSCDFADIVQKYCDYIIVSGFVAISHGRARGTDDIDMIIPIISETKFLMLHKNLIDNGFECIQSENPKNIFDYLKDNISVRYRRKGEFLPEMELKFAKDELDNYQIKNRKKFPLTGTELYFSSIECNIAFKEELLKSQKDFEDARYLRIIYSDSLDEKEIKNIKEKIKKLRLNNG